MSFFKAIPFRDWSFNMGGGIWEAGRGVCEKLLGYAGGSMKKNHDQGSRGVYEK